MPFYFWETSTILFQTFLLMNRAFGSEHVKCNWCIKCMHHINYSMLTEKGKRNLYQLVISLWNL